jgi:hypothetical protein
VAYTYSGTGQYHTAAANYAYQNPLARAWYAWSFWFRRNNTSTSEQTVALKGGTGSSSPIVAAVLGGNRLDFFCNFNTTTANRRRVGVAVLDSDTTNWHHAFCVIDRGNNLLYVLLDGALPTQTDVWGTTFTGWASTDSIAPTQALRLAANSSATGLFTGSIEDFAVWRAGISPSQADVIAMAARIYAGEPTARVRPELQTSCYPLDGATTDIRRWATSLTATGTPTRIDGPVIAHSVTEADTLLWDGDSFADAAGTQVVGTATDGGRTWEAAWGSTASDLVVTAEGFARVADSITRVPIATINANVPTRDFDLSCTLRVKSAIGNAILIARGNTGTAGAATRLAGAVLASNGRCLIEQVVAGVATTLADTGTRTALSVGDHTLRFRVVGHMAELWLDGVRLCAAATTNSAFNALGSTGRIGFALDAQAGAHSATTGTHLGAFRARWDGVVARDLATSSNAGGAGPGFGYAVPVIAVGNEYVNVYGLEKISDSGDDASQDLVQWRADKASLISDPAGVTWAKTYVANPGSATFAGLGPGGAAAAYPTYRADGVRMVAFVQLAPPGVGETTAGIGNTGDLTHKHYFMTSEDAGSTWSSPTLITTQTKGSDSYAYVPGQDGLCLLPNDRVALWFGEALTASNTNWRLGLIYSDPPYTTWTRVVVVASGSFPEGHIFLTGPNNGVVRARENDNDDNGNRFYTFVNTPGGGISVSGPTNNATIWGPVGDGSSVSQGFARAWRDGQAVFGGTLSTSTRTTLAVRASADSAATWTGQLTGAGRVSPGNILDISESSYADVETVGADHLLVVHTGGGQAGFSTNTNLARITAYLVPRSWTGLSGPSSGGGFVLLGNGFL